MRLVLLLLTPVVLAAQQPLRFTAVDRVVDATASADGKMVAWSVMSADTATDRFTPQVWFKDGERPAQLLGQGRAVRLSADGHTIARLAPVDGTLQLVVRDSLAGSDRTLSSLPHGVTGFRISPNGTEVVFTSDGSQPASIGRRYHGGDASARQSLYIVPIAGGSVRRLTGDDFQLGAEWPNQPDGHEYDWLNDSTLMVSGREPSSGESTEAASLYLIDVATGARRYFTGKGGRWVRPVVSPDRKWIAFTGQPLSAGPWHASELVVMPADGSSLKRLTVGLDRDVGDVGWSGNSKSIWFATESRGVRNLHRIEIKNGKEKAATTGQQMLQIAAVADDEVLAIRHSSSEPGTLISFPEDHPEQIKQVVVPDTVAAPGELGELEVRVADGTVLDGWLRRPAGFKVGESAPLLIDLHGGPHAMAGAGYSPWSLAHAASGWLVLRANPRGSTGYGFDIANGLDRTWPGQDVADLEEMLRHLIDQGIVDTTRIAVVGTGAGAVSALALAAAEPLVGKVVLRCPGGAWLPGGSGYDSPLWSEWLATRPFRMTASLWQRRSPLDGSLTSTAPTLILEGIPGAAEPVEFGAAAASALALAGVQVSFVRLPDSCAALGPRAQAGAIELEQEWLRRTAQGAH